MFKLIQNERIKSLNENQENKGEYILYWMQSSPRSHYNHALEFAVQKSRDIDLPLLCFFGLTSHFLEANQRHYQFLLEGLKDTQNALGDKNIQLIVWDKSPEIGAVELSQEASLTITDRGYMRLQRQWQDEVAKNI